MANTVMIDLTLTILRESLGTPCLYSYAYRKLTITASLPPKHPESFSSLLIKSRIVYICTYFAFLFKILDDRRIGIFFTCHTVLQVLKYRVSLINDNTKCISYMKWLFNIATKCNDQICWCLSWILMQTSTMPSCGGPSSTSHTSTIIRIIDDVGML